MPSYPSSSSSSLLQRLQLSLSCILSLALLVCLPTVVQCAPLALQLGSCASFSVLAGTTLTNSGPSSLGDMGVSPGTATTGFPPGHFTSRFVGATGPAADAQSDLAAAYTDAASRTGAIQLAAADLGGLVLVSGVYSASSSLLLTGSVTLDGAGQANGVWIFQVASTLSTASGAVVKLINGAQACNVFWQVGSSATLGTGTVFAGSILVLTSISVSDLVRVDGRLLARNGAVTLINNQVKVPVCSVEQVGETSPSSPPAGIVGDPQFVGLRGQRYQVHGVSGFVYSIVSDSALQYNARFVFLDSGRCPQLPIAAPTHGRRRAADCWSHPGSYLGELGLKTPDGDRVHVVSGAYDVGFALIEVNGQPLAVGDEIKLEGDATTASPESDSGSGGVVHRLSTHQLSVCVGAWIFVFDNSDFFMNQRVSLLDGVDVSSLRSHGLLGQTWRAETYPSNVIKYVAGNVDDYVVSELFGDDHAFNAFKLTNQHATTPQ